MEFDMEGNLLRHWGGDAAGYEWPTKEDGIFVDRQGFVWVAGNGTDDRQVLKFTRDGEFIMQIGHKSTEPPQNLRSDILGQPAAFDVDEERRELYIADGYLNRRVIVFDCDTGAFKRLWGAYGNAPEDVDPGPYNPKDPICKQFRNPVHCVKIAHDGLVYVGDRANDRIQVFTKAGEYLKEFFIFPETIGPFINPNRQQCGSVWDIVLSLDEAQKYLFVADGSNNVIWTVRRSDGKVLGKSGHAGRNAGQFHWLHHMASDSFGNLYTGEVDSGKRAQRFILLNPESQGLTNPPSAPTPPPA
jgi:DNA-binding beta-propeller fold protein YncE